MSQATFLSADRQLTKTFYVGGKSDPYPLVKNFTSMVVNYEGTKELGEILETVGSSGYCLLKGELSKQIDNEPRVGLTNATAPTDLLVIDYDSDGGFTSIPELLETIDPVLADTDYIFQHSASSGITGKSGIRGHVFILLSHAVAPAVLKQWLKKVNLSEPKFKDRIKLSRNAMSLCYALDITVNQNDKLIYLAPPKLVGLDDPIEERYSFHEGENRTYTYNATISAESNRTKEHALIADLQDRAGLTKRVPKYKMSGDTEMLTNPVNCTVSDPTDCGPYVRVNLNGGDSLAYWYSKENYEILYNFKGEPAVYLKDVASEYYESLQRKAQAATLRPFIFREVETDKYYNAEFNEKTNRLEYCFQASRAALNDFMAQRGAPIRRDAVIPDWAIFFNPSVKLSVDFVAKRLNLFDPSIYIDSTLGGEFPIIERIVRHICVNEETYVHFINWLAHITQFRTKTQTAWIFAGTEGTGKGTLFHQILSPILGAKQTFMIGQDQAEDQFNGYMRTNMLLFLDEGDIETSKQADKMMAKFRTVITDPTIAVRQMRTTAINVDSYTNLIIATNKSMPVKLTDGDRRYNIAPRQNEKLVITTEEYNEIKNELQAFTGYLNSRQIQESDSYEVLKSDAREDLMELSKTVADTYFRALEEGDLDYFADALLETMPVNNPDYIAYAKVVQGWMASAGTEVLVYSTELLITYQYLNNGDITDKKFGHLCKRHQLEPKRIRVDGLLKRVYPLTFVDRDYGAWLNRNNKLTLVPKITLQPNEIAQ